MQPILDFVSAFTTISEYEMNAMLGIIHTSTHKKNEMLHQQGSIPAKAAFIVKGAVRSFYIDENGLEHTSAFLFENQPLVFFENFAQQTPSHLSAVTLEPTELIWTSHQEFLAFLETFPKYEKVLRHILSKHMMLKNEQTKLLRIASSKDRYDALCKTNPEVIKRVPMKHIASYLHMALETLSRVRSGK